MYLVAKRGIFVLSYLRHYVSLLNLLSMESMDFLTKGDLALFEHYNNGNMPYYGCYKHRDNVATTGIGLAAGLGGAALLGIFAIGWGLNQASKARANGANQANNMLCNNLAQLSSLVLAERQSRETWQHQHAPSMTQYVDVQTGAGAFAGSNSSAQSSALAQAEANLLTQSLLGNLNQCPQKVSLYSSPMPCGCVQSPCNCNG